MLSRIIYEDINEKFGYGEYLGFKVIIMKENGYINATKMCKQIGKRFKDWNENKKTQEYLDYKKKSLVGIPADPIIEILNENNEIKGSYVHPDIIVHIASWASYEVADKVSKIVNGQIISEYESKIERLESTNQTQDFKINTLESKIQNNKDFLNESDEYLVIQETEPNKYYFSRVQKAGLARVMNRGIERDYKYINTLHTVNNSLQALNSVCKRDKIEKHRNTVTCENIDQLQLDILEFIKSLQ